MVTKGGTVKLPVGMLVKCNIIGIRGSFLLFLLQHPSPWVNCILPRFQSPYDYVATYKS